MTQLVLWRHGQTEYNRAGRVQGRDDVPLNEAGLGQAAAAAPELAALEPTGIVCSPLARARGTAEALARVTGLDVVVEPDLIERSFGVWEGLSGREIEAGWPEAYRIWRDGGDPEGVGVETRAAVATRVGDALKGIAARAGKDACVVVAAHAAATTLGAIGLLGLDPSGWSGIRSMDNCRHAVLRTAGRAPGWMLVGWNLGAAHQG